MGHTAAGDAWGDAPGAELAAVGVVVVAAVGEQLTGLAPRPPAPATDGRHGLDQRDELGDVVAVAAGEGDGQRDAAGLADQVVLGTRPTAVDW